MIGEWGWGPYSNDGSGLRFWCGCSLLRGTFSVDSPHPCSYPTQNLSCELCRSFRFVLLKERKNDGGSNPIPVLVKQKEVLLLGLQVECLGPCCRETCGKDCNCKVLKCFAPSAYINSPQPGSDPGLCGCDGECETYDMGNDTYHCLRDASCSHCDGTFCIYVGDTCYTPPRHRSHYVYTTFPPEYADRDPKSDSAAMHASFISKKERSMHRCAVRFWVAVCIFFVVVTLLCGLRQITTVSWINKVDTKVFLSLAATFFFIAFSLFFVLACCSRREREEPSTSELFLITPTSMETPKVASFRPGSPTPNPSGAKTQGLPRVASFRPRPSEQDLPFEI